MKIQIVGEHPAAALLRGYLKALGYQVSDHAAEGNATYSISAELAAMASIAVQGPPGAFAEEAVRRIAELTSVSVEWFPAGAGAANAIHIAAPDIHADAIGRGLLRALLLLTRHGAAQDTRFGIISKLWQRLIKKA
jgi:hypothetical protein